MPLPAWHSDAERITDAAIPSVRPLVCLSHSSSKSVSFLMLKTRTVSVVAWWHNCRAIKSPQVRRLVVERLFNDSGQVVYIHMSRRLQLIATIWRR